MAQEINKTIDKIEQLLQQSRAALRLPMEEEMEDNLETTRDPMSSTQLGTTETIPQQSTPRQATEDAMEQAARILAQTFAQQLSQTVQNQRQATPNLPVFHGLDYEDPDVFIAQLREHFRRTRCDNDNDKVHTAAAQLRGEAEKWYEPYKNLPITFRHFQDRLKNKYDSIPVVAAARTRLYGERQREHEGVELFITKKLMLFARLEPDMNDAMIANTILEQLRPEIRSRLRTHYFDNADHLIQVTSQIESDLQKIAAHQSKPKNGGSATNSNNNNPQPSTSTGGTTNKNGGTNGKGKPYPCKRCQGSHIFGECPLRRQQGNEERVAGPSQKPTGGSDQPTPSAAK